MAYSGALLLIVKVSVKRLVVVAQSNLHSKFALKMVNLNFKRSIFYVRGDEKC